VRRPVLSLLSVAAIGFATVALRLAVTNPTTVALGYLLVVLSIAASGDLVIAVAASLGATFCLNFFFLPPIGTLTIADPHNWVALFAFLFVSIVASQLSASARARAQDALERRNEVTRLFDITRDILLTTDGTNALPSIARHVARRFELPVCAICVPVQAGGWTIHHGGETAIDLARHDLDRAFAEASGALQFDARSRAYSGHRETASPAGPIDLTPVRIGTRASGILATGGRSLEPGTRDAVAGIVAIAIERLDFLRERDGAELARQRAELASALLASLSHDLRTPLTAIRTAISNLDSLHLPDHQRRDQAQVAAGQIDRLTRLFDSILDMARIDTGTIRPQRRWTTPAEIVEGAVQQSGPALAGRDVQVDAPDDVSVEVDPRLAASALSHLLENAARYAPEGPIDVRAVADDSGLRLEVRDRGPGLQPSELENLFKPFFRGEVFRQRTTGTGMGLAITRGLVAADGGRVWAENLPDGGACFHIAIPAASRRLAAVE
jgi:two-component system sensor histidine kinase KdpD